MFSLLGDELGVLTLFVFIAVSHLQLEFLLRQDRAIQSNLEFFNITAIDGPETTLLIPAAMVLDLDFSLALILVGNGLIR